MTKAPDDRVREIIANIDLYISQNEFDKANNEASFITLDDGTNQSRSTKQELKKIQKEQRARIANAKKEYEKELKKANKSDSFSWLPWNNKNEE